MFLTVFGQKGGVAKTCTSIHLACVWAQQGLSVCVVDADRNRSATAYAARGMLPFEVVPVEAESICLHGDGAHAILFAREIKKQLEQKGITISAQ